MQNMIPVSRNGNPARAFFDIDWENKRIENITVFEGSQRVKMTPKDLMRLTTLIEDEVSAIVIEAAKELAHGTLMEA